MDIIIPKPDLHRLIQAVIKAVPARGPLPVLTHLLIQAEGERVTVQAYDMEMGITATLDSRVTVRSPGVALLAAKTLGEIVAKLPDLDVSIQVEGLEAVIKAGRTKYKVRTLAPSEYPEMPRIEGKVAEVGCVTLASAIAQTAYAAAGEDKAVISGVLFDFTDGLSLVATDGYRLALAPADGERVEGAAEGLTIPRRVVKELQKHLEAAGESVVTVRTAGTGLVFEMPGRSIFTRLLEGQFPPFRQIIPTDNPHECAIGREELLAAVERVGVMASDREASIIVLAFESEQVTLSAQHADLGESVEVVPCGYIGEPLKMIMNATFMAETLRAVRSDTLHLEIKAPLSPVLVKPKRDDGRLALLMPLNRV